MSWVAQTAPAGLRATALAVRITGNRLGQVAVPAAVGSVASSAGVGGVLLATSAVVALAAASACRTAMRPSWDGTTAPQSRPCGPPPTG
jgi:hypothetical protein